MDQRKNEMKLKSSFMIGQQFSHDSRWLDGTSWAALNAQNMCNEFKTGLICARNAHWMWSIAIRRLILIPWKWVCETNNKRWLDHSNNTKWKSSLLREEWIFLFSFRFVVNYMRGNMMNEMIIIILKHSLRSVGHELSIHEILLQSKKTPNLTDSKPTLRELEYLGKSIRVGCSTFISCAPSSAHRFVRIIFDFNQIHVPTLRSRWHLPNVCCDSISRHLPHRNVLY